LATLDVIEREHLLDHVRAMGDYALTGLRELMSRHELIGDVRGLGLILGVELVRNRRTMERALEESERVMYRALSLGLNFKVTMGNILTLTPPLTVTQEEIGKAWGILDRCLHELKNVPR